MEWILAGLIILAFIAVSDLIVGVSNDAVNFLNSSIGSRVAPRYVIMIVATLGIIFGVTFSSGMMEIARKGIFHPQLFTLPELMMVFLSVMLADIILLDLFNTYGLPTSTTVSIVFELLGAAVAVSCIKILKEGSTLLELGSYINTEKALLIIAGILLSVIVAFICGAVFQFITRLVFSFDYRNTLKKFGALWGGIALSAIVYFILVKGAKGASFLTSENVAWIKTHTVQLLIGIFIASGVLLQILLFMKVNILKIVILIGTFALAMAFAANDLVNFIGVPMAGLRAYQLGAAAENPLTASMEGMTGSVQANTFLLLAAGLVMAITLSVSKKARGVTNTSVGLGRQSEGAEKYDSTFLSKFIVKMVIDLFEIIKVIIPSWVISWIKRRFRQDVYCPGSSGTGSRPSFDQIRASVNLMVAAAVISYATSFKLPLSTTYVTFMVAMGTSFADMAWGRESAVYRITGVLTVVGGWFITAFAAFLLSGLFAVIIFYFLGYGVAALLILVGFLIWKTHLIHREQMKQDASAKIFDLESVEDYKTAVDTVSDQMCFFISEVSCSLERTQQALFDQNIYTLNSERNKAKKVQKWANTITANIFKTMRFMQQLEVKNSSLRYAQTIRRIQKLVDGYRDIVQRSYDHISNHHKGLKEVQIEELREVKDIMNTIFTETEKAFTEKDTCNSKVVKEKDRELRDLAKELGEKQAMRIKTIESKTRLSILYYAIVGNAMMLSKQTRKLLKIFTKGIISAEKERDFDLD